MISCAPSSHLWSWYDHFLWLPWLFHTGAHSWSNKLILDVYKLHLLFLCYFVCECVNWQQQEGDPGKKNRANWINGCIKCPSCILSVGDTNKMSRIDEPHM